MLFTNFPTIQELSLNGNIETRTLTELQSMLLNMKRLCLDWDLKNNYKEYFVEKYFQKNYKTFNIKNATNKAKDMINQLSNNTNNNHLWSTIDYYYYSNIFKNPENL